MAGSSIRCGEFEGEDKSGSPALAVLTQAYRRLFHRKPRGRLALALTAVTGGKRSGVEGLAESAMLSVKYDDVGKIPTEVCACLLPELQKYQKEVLARLNISDDVEQIFPRMAKSRGAKYGRTHDDGWHAYCLHDLIPAFKKSVNILKPVEILW
jgi:hypothetical protein